MAQTSRNLARVSFSVELIQTLITEDGPVTFECTKGIPTDAIFIGLVEDAGKLSVSAILYHPSFPVVREGGEIPIIDIEHKITTWQEQLKQLGIALKTQEDQ